MKGTNVHCHSLGSKERSCCRRPRFDSQSTLRKFCPGILTLFAFTFLHHPSCNSSGTKAHDSTHTFLLLFVMKFIGIQIFEVSIEKVGVGLYHFLAHFLLLISHFFDFCECHAFESCQVSKTDLLLPFSIALLAIVGPN